MALSGIKHGFLDPTSDGSEGSLGTLGHYRVLSELGKGGMGYVFLAEDTRLKRQVALKVMNQKIANTPGSKKRFISEARAMAAVHHDNVATIFEVGERNGTPFMAMELLEGSTLENYRQHHGEPDYQTVIAFARDIARGLAAAHAQGIVHRDIKPANIWLDTKTGRIKILDFGLALAKTPVDQLSGRGAVVGTPGYLSPEQARSEPLDDRSDLYATGVVLYELATGSLPLKTKSVAEQLIAILAHPPTPLRDRNDKIPEPLANLIHRLMAKEPRDRYRSAVELEKALDEVEVECEKKSEVAQAINQLQMGLEKAVSKSNPTDDGSGMGLSEQAQPNPFETLPDVLPAATPIASGMSSSGIHPAVPVGQQPSAAGPLGSGSFAAANVAKNAKSKAGEPRSNSHVIYIAIGVCAAVLLLLIPIIVYLSDSSAIARQQDRGTTVVGVDTAPQPAASNRQNNPPPKPKQDQSTKPPKPNASPQPPAATSTLITKVSAKEVDSVAGQGAKWIIGNQQANGSFEEGDVAKGTLKLPSWTATKSGNDAGWVRLPNSPNPEQRTVAYAGRNSQLVLTSDVLKHQTKAGDVFRVGMNIGGEGSGTTNYNVVLGFKGDAGPPTLYQLADVSSPAKWRGGKQKRLMFEYAVDESVAGKKPFLQLTVSNDKPKRTRGMLDRVVLTVRSTRNLAANPGATPDPTSVADAQVRPQSPASPGQSTAPGQSKAPAQSTAPGSRMVSSDSADAMPTADPAARPTEPSSTESSRPPSAASQSAASQSAASQSPADNDAAGPKAVRQVIITTASEGGADATVKRGGSISGPLGGELTLAIQTRNNRQVQHSYMRFPLLSLHGETQRNQNRNRKGGGNANGPRLPIATAELRLMTTGNNKRPGDATLRVYGLRDLVSDLWPENRLEWSDTLSNGGIEKLPLLAETKIEPDDQVVSISNPLLADFLAQADGRSVTLILTGSTGNELVNFVAKEAGGESAPALILGMSE